MKHIQKFESFFSNIFKKDKKRTDEVIIRKMKQKDVRKCLDIKYQYFGHFYGDVNNPNTKKSHDNYTIKKLDLTVSLVAEKNGEIVGGYFLKKTKVPNIIGSFYDFSNYNDNGVEGVSLFVHPDYKSEGVGHKLKYYYKNNSDDISFIWGQAFHGLDNMKHWLKNRVLFNDLGGIFFTIEFYKGSISDFPQTKYLEFYNKYKKQAAYVVG